MPITEEQHRKSLRRFVWTASDVEVEEVTTSSEKESHGSQSQERDGESERR